MTSKTFSADFSRQVSNLPFDKLDSAYMRSEHQVMDVRRLGSLFQTRHSFMRVLMRRMMQDDWCISHRHFKLNEQGFGFVDYQITTPRGDYTYVVFAHELEGEQRNDRVIADQWDATMALCKGAFDLEQIGELARNVPIQEAGRYNSDVLVLSRGNRSSRMFDYAVDCLAQGRQPEAKKFEQVGYLYRTTAVYGSGKFGMADWRKVKTQCPDFASPFAAEMFNCYMLRHFSVEQAEHIAKHRSPTKSVTLNSALKRYVGIGNSTGLGMAPFLIRHPKLISAWIHCREKNYARIKQFAVFNQKKQTQLVSLLRRAQQHLSETLVEDTEQQQRNSLSEVELSDFINWLNQIQNDELELSCDVLFQSIESLSVASQELLISILMELFPEIAIEEYPDVNEEFFCELDQSIGTLAKLIEGKYDWALKINFNHPSTQHYFWYRSEEKMEPRLGQRQSEPGAESEMPLNIAMQVVELYRAIKAFDDDMSVAEFLRRQPRFSTIVPRVQTMAQQHYAEIRVNMTDQNMRPMDLLRCKLSFFGVSKFDPKSTLWVRNTMFQGAPTVDEIGHAFNDDWYFPVKPVAAKH